MSLNKDHKGTYLDLWIFFFFENKNPHIVFSPLYPKLALKPL